MATDIVTTIITSLPNLAVAIWCLWQNQKTIDKLIDQQNKLVDQLMALHPPQDDKKTVNSIVKGETH